MFIVFEGIDGSGKSSAAKRLLHKLTSAGKLAEVTAEPTKLPTGKFIRKILGGEFAVAHNTLACLFHADRLEHIAHMKTQLDTGKIVICDRYVLSTFAYEGLRDFDARDILRPDLTFYFDVSVDTALKRMSASRDKAEIFEKREKLEVIQGRYAELCREYKGTDNIHVIDAEKSPDVIGQEIFEIVKATLTA
jgi:dTMP kinase